MFYLWYILGELEESDDEYLYRNCLDSVDLTTEKKQEKSLLSSLATSPNDERSSGQSASDLVLYNTIKREQYNSANAPKSMRESHRAEDVLS